MRNKNFIILSVALIVLALAVMSVASAEFWACADKGERTDYCNNYKPPRTCTSNNGCIYCMSEYREADDCYIHGVWPQCNQQPQICDLTGGNGTGVDGVAPIITPTSPSNDALFSSRKVPVMFTLSETANVYYLDLINGRGRWGKLCSDCTLDYKKNVTFEEGHNLIQFKAIDPSGNEGFSGNVSFFTDSKKPKIKKTSPKKGFANGEFSVDFQEQNPAILTLYYGHNGSSSMDVPLSNCVPSGTSNDKQHCEVNADLSAYNGQEIDYWFTLTDIVGNSINSKVLDLEVDLTAPVINNPSSFFTYQTGTKYVQFNLSITETNFDEVIYSYTDSRGKFKEKTICSRLKEGVCGKRLSFKEGEYHLTVSAWDEAGNSVALPADFTVDIL